MGKHAAPWHASSPSLFAAERSVLHQRCPDPVVSVAAGLVVAAGRLAVHGADGELLGGYLVEIRFPRDYPDWVPDLYMRQPGVACVGERHIERSGRACLCLPHEVPSYFPDGIAVAPFLDRLVSPWLLGQAHFDRFGNWPYPGRSHGFDGVLEGLGEMLGCQNPATVARFAPCLVSEEDPKGHLPCPCGSGRRLRACHRDVVLSVRTAVPERARAVYRRMLSLSRP